MNLHSRSGKKAAMMYVLRFRDIPREVEARVRMTVYLLPVSVQRQASSF